MYNEDYEKRESDDRNGEEMNRRSEAYSENAGQDVGEVNFTMRDAKPQQPAGGEDTGNGYGMKRPVSSENSSMGDSFRHSQDAGQSSQPYQQNINPDFQPYQQNAGQDAQSYQQNAGQGPQYQQYAPWQQPTAAHQRQQKRRSRKTHPILRKAAGITAAALLFGAVAGGTISGISLFTNGLAARYSQKEPQVSQAETLPAPSQAAQADSNAASATQVVFTNDVSAIVEKAMPSVVAINSVTEYQTQTWFGQPQVYQGKGSGSGIIVGESDTELLIVTNNHVVEGSKSLSVVFNDSENVEANIKGTDSENDLAVIAVALDKIKDSTKSKIAVATLGDSDSLKVGQGVIAIGNALGYGQSVTVGYISALDREVRTDEMTTRNLLQTDAAINPGNSGGALLNMQGEVIGINSAKYSSTDVEGMGYAIPISKVHDIIDDLMTKKTRVQVEESKQGYLGIQGTDIDSNASTLYGMPQGIYVYKIVEGGAAAASDLKEKDIITKFDGQSVRSMQELKDMLTYYAGGDTVDLTVQSLVDGQYIERTVTITLGFRPTEEQTH